MLERVNRRDFERESARDFEQASACDFDAGLLAGKWEMANKRA